MRQKVYFKTFGCRTNVFDSQVMMSGLEDFDITENESEADVVVVNSCTVTNGADSHVRTYINQVERNIGAKVFLTGCGAHSKGESLFENNKVFGVFGQSEKKQINTLLKKDSRFYQIGDLDFIDDSVVDDFVGKSRAFIKIQEGCNFRCSYCIIPAVRGDARSIDEALILDQVKRLGENGFGEFILTGTNVGSYGHREGRSIAALMKKMSQLKGVRRIRVGSMEPIQVTPEFKEILDEPWLERHLHIAVQHSSDEMLRIMNRRNRVKNDIELFGMLNDKGFALGTDFIVGHPGESDALWSEAIENFKRLNLTHLHAFTYSKRDGTASAQMKEQVNGNVSKVRMQELEGIVSKNNLALRKSVAEKNIPLEVLIESQKENLFYGYDQYFNKITVESSEDLNGNWMSLDNYKIEEKNNYAKL